MGVMAINILKHGEHPVVFYGQDYMGVLQAYLGAIIFQFFGVSIFGLRLGLILLYVAFLLCMYVLTRQLYSKRFALFMTLLFTFGSAALLSRQLIAIGGYPDLLFFATVSLVIGVHLALSAPKDTVRDRISRHGMFFLWGIAVALGIWSDTLILPWIALSGLILLFSWRDLLFKGAIFSLLIGLLLGAVPLIIYNLGALPGQHTISVLLSQEGQVPLTVSILREQMKNTFAISLPIITGNPICLKSSPSLISIDYWGFNDYWSSHCVVIGTVWSSCYLALWVSAVTVAAFTFKKLLTPLRGRVWSLEERRQLVLTGLQAILLLGVMASILPYLRSRMVLSGPGENARYMIGLWIAFPALLWPLWQCVAHINIEHYVSRSFQTFVLMRRALCFSFLIGVLAIFVAGSVLAVGQAPTAHYEQTREQNIINTLESKGITHVYAGYWFAYRIAFASNTRIVCAVIIYNYGNNHKVISGENKYTPYFNAVESDPYASYAIPANSDGRLKQIIEQKFKAIKYRTFVVDDYLIYQPFGPVKKSV